MSQSTADKAQVLDLEAYPTAQKLVTRCKEFFAEIQNLQAAMDLLFCYFSIN